MARELTALVRMALLMTALLCAPAFAEDKPIAAPAQPVASSPAKPPARLVPKPVPPRSPEKVELAIGRGVQFLLADQNKNGSWGSAQRTKGLDIYAPIPGAHHAFRSAVTALCVSALIETGDRTSPVDKAINRGEQWLLSNLPHLRRATPDALYNVWGHAYAIEALVNLEQQRPGDAARKAKIVELIQKQVGFLNRYASVDGGWGYYDFRGGTQRPASESTSFTTATALMALHRAQELGVPVPEKMVKRAMDSLVRQRKNDFSYLYSANWRWRPMGPINRVGGSLGRSQACNLALKIWGDERITDEVLEQWLDNLWARHLWLDLARKRPVPHDSYFAVAGYFFYYGHYHAALCIDRLPPPERDRHRDHLAYYLLKLQEKDGSWWDYPLYNYHQQYGTAFAVSSLVRCRQDGLPAK